MNTLELLLHPVRVRIVHAMSGGLTRTTSDLLARLPDVSNAAASMTLEEHRDGFTAAMAALVAEFNTYLDQPHAQPTEDKVGYRQIPLWLSQDELAELISQIRSVLLSKTDNQPAPGRRLHLLSPIIFPIGKTGTTPD